MRNKYFLIISGIFLLLFFLAALFTSGTQGFLLDENIAYWAEQKQSGFLFQLMKGVTIIGKSEVILIITVIIGLIFLIQRNWQQFFFFFILSVGGVILNFVLKMGIQRERPGDEVKYIDVFNLNLELQSYSFPSGHAMRVTILFLFLMYLAYLYLHNDALKIGSYIAGIIILILVALSRIVLDAHHATDVIAAILISTSWFFLILYFFHSRKRSRYNPTYINR